MTQLVRRRDSLRADLASTAAGRGAALVALADAGGYFGTDQVEAALQQLAPGAVPAPWLLTKDSPVLLSLRHATSGNIIQQWQDGTPGTATYMYRGLSVQTDSHAMQMGPATSGGSVDLLFQRSAAHPTDPAGNRFNITYSESVDRLDLSFATAASGAPVFDSFCQVYAGPSAVLAFPALAAQFNLGLSVKQRAAGGFELALTPTSSTQALLQQVGGSGSVYMTFRDGAMGFFGSIGTSRITLPAAANSTATTQTLANAIRDALIAYGLCA